MKKMTLAVLASVALLAGCTGQMLAGDSGPKHDKTYVSDGGKPVKNGDNCVVAAGNNGTYFEECDGGKAMADKAMADKAAMQEPEPKVITRVIVDCTKCPK